jgi:ABC-type amino acid transport substrate-binding protein
MLGAGVVAVTTILVLGTRTVLAATFAGRYQRTEAMTSFHDPVETTEIRLIDRSAPNPLPLAEGMTRLERAVERGAIRIGYAAGNQPWIFFNEQGDVVGFDIDLVRRLAIDLGVAIELVPFEPDSLEDQLGADHFDFAIGGIYGTLDLANALLLTRPYLTGNGALLVRDHRRKQLDTLQELRMMGDELTLAVLRRGYSGARMRRLLPRAQLVEIRTDAEFFELEGVDALATTAEGGSYWTLSHPGYSVVLPISPPPQVPLVFAVAQTDRQFVEWLDRWIEWMQNDGAIDEMFAHWIQGEAFATREPRWSIGSNVLGWW